MTGHPRAAITSYERWTRFIGLYLLAPVFLLLSLPVALDIARGPYSGMAVRNLQVATVDPGSPADRAGLRPGDRIMAVDGRTPRTMVDFFVITASHRDHAPQHYLVRRDDTELPVIVLPTPPPQSAVVWSSSLYLAGLAFLVIGWWVLYRRQDVVARTFFGLSFIFAFILMDAPRWPSTLYTTAVEVARDLLILLLPAIFLRFFLYFPLPGRLPPEQKRRHRLLLAPAVVLFGLSLYAQAARVDPEASTLVVLVQAGALLYFSSYVIAALLIFARKVLRRDRPLQHSKLRVVLFGLCVGLIPFLLASFLSNFVPELATPSIKWLGFSLVLVPLSFGLAILRYGALDTGFVIRHGLVYAALTLLLGLAYFVSIGLLGHFLTSTFHVSTYPLALATVAATALVVLPVRRVVQRWIDRAFYPSRRATRAAIEALGRELTGLIDSAEAAQTLVTRLQGLYAPRRLSLLLADARSGQLDEFIALSNGKSASPVFRLPVATTLARTLFAAGRPLFREEFELRGVGEEPDPESSVLLERLGGELLVPLITGNRLAGLLVLGPRQDGSLYTQDDLANLRLLAVQAAALIENTRLYQESLARRLVDNELSLAHEIQAHLIPTAPLELPGIRLCGRMETCREVGGDYFDYFPIDERSVGFAIADVAGKGVPAALLMSTLRVTFRSEAARARDPERVVARLNESVCGLDASGSLVGFFFGIYTREDNRLAYCNAGMEPPVLFRRDRPFVDRLKKGGPMLGAQAGIAYRRGVLSLVPGDLLLLFTDGMTDEVNAAGDFFDLERLVAAARTNLSRPLEELREAILSAVDEFGGTHQTDDRTLMLLQINSL